MSIPLWEECAWFIDDELEVAPESTIDNSAEENQLSTNPENVHSQDPGQVEEEEEEISPPDGEEGNCADATNSVGSSFAIEEVNPEEVEEFTQAENAIEIDIIDANEEPLVPPVEYKFNINKSINKRIHLHIGEIYKLPCDAIVVGQVESLMDRHDGNDAIFSLAGTELLPELESLAPCSTGDSVVTKGGLLPCEWIIHSVGPKFDERYLIASDHALFAAYKSALVLAADKEAQRVVISCLYKQSKRYPRFDAAHVALRTVRRFLEHPVGDIFEKVMFCVANQEDFEIYSAQMHAYFPRTPEELEDQLNLLPIECGDEWGEVVIPDRQLKVSAGPKPLPTEISEQYQKSASNEQLNVGEELPVGDDTTSAAAAAAELRQNQSPRSPSPSTAVAATGSSSNTTKKSGQREVKPIGHMPRSMTNMESDPDLERKRKINTEFAQMSRLERLTLRFQAMLQDIEDEDLSHVEELKLVEVWGKDLKNRTVVFLNGTNLLEAERMDPDLVALAIMKQMEPMRCIPFVLVFGVARVGDDRYHNLNFLQMVFDIFNCRYKDNMIKMYLLHASFTYRMYFWMQLPMEIDTFYPTYWVTSNLAELNDYMNLAIMDLPEEVLRFDREYGY